MKILIQLVHVERAENYFFASSDSFCSNPICTRNDKHSEDPGKNKGRCQKMKTKHLNLLMLAGTATLLCASVSRGATAAETSALAEDPAHPLYRPWTVGLEAGTTGLGGSGSWRFSDHFGTRLGVDYIEYSQDGTKLGNLHYDTKLRLLSEPLTLDIYPWQKHSFHISVGMMFNQNEATGSLSDTGPIYIAGRQFSSLDVIPLHLKIEQQPVNPYFGIGGNFFYFDRAHHWAMGGELGVAYTGDPKVSLYRSGPSAPLIDAVLSQEQKNIQNDLDQYRWYPVVKLTVNFSF
jgi:hypothetical protein